MDERECKGKRKMFGSRLRGQGAFIQPLERPPARFFGWLELEMGLSREAPLPFSPLP